MAPDEDDEHARPLQGRRLPKSPSRRKAWNRHRSSHGSQNGLLAQATKDRHPRPYENRSTRESRFTIFVSINLRRDLLIRRVPLQLVGNKLPLQQVVRQAVDELLTYVAPPHRVVHHEPVLIALCFLAFLLYVTISNHILKNR